MEPRSLPLIASLVASGTLALALLLRHLPNGLFELRFIPLA
jgi:hypothetical protein